MVNYLNWVAEPSVFQSPGNNVKKSKGLRRRKKRRREREEDIKWEIQRERFLQ